MDYKKHFSVLLIMIIVFLFSFLLDVYSQKHTHEIIKQLFLDFGISYQKIPEIIVLNAIYLFFITIVFFIYIYDTYYKLKINPIALIFVIVIIFLAVINFITSRILVLETSLYLENSSKVKCFNSDQCLESVLKIRNLVKTCKNNEINNENCTKNFNSEYHNIMKNNNLNGE